MSFSYRATDALLFDTSLTFDERLVLAATLGHPTRSPSLTETADATGLHRQTVRDLQVALNHHHPSIVRHDDGRVTIKVREGEDGVPEIPLPVALWQRPYEWFERNPTDPRYGFSNTLLYVREQYDPRAPANKGRWIELPASIHTRLARGKGVSNAAIVRLVALVYASEQLQRGAIQMDDYTLAELLGADKKQIGKIRRRLIEDGILRVVQHGKKTDPVYTMPGAAPGSSKTSADFDATKTKRMMTLQIAGGEFYSVLTSEAGYEHLVRLFEAAPPTAAEAFWQDRSIHIYGEGWNTLDAMLQALEIAIPTTGADPAPVLKKHPAGSHKEPSRFSERTGRALPTTYYPIKPSTPTDHAHQDGPPSPSARPDGEERTRAKASGDEEQKREHRHPYARARRDFKPREFGYKLFYFIDDAETDAYVLRVHKAITAKHSPADANSFLRDAINPAGPDTRSTSTAVAAWLYRRFHLDVPTPERLRDDGAEPDQADYALDVLLDSDFGSLD
jgi:hypothetical protein